LSIDPNGGYNGLSNWANRTESTISMRNSLLAGTAKVDITPPLTIPYLGYEPRHALFQGWESSRGLCAQVDYTPVLVISIHKEQC
jgi:hypothetical protein